MTPLTLNLCFILLGYLYPVDCSPQRPSPQRPQQQCPSIAVRRNIRSISPSEWSSYASAFRILAENGDLEQLARVHDANFRDIHDSPQFLLWHRYFLHDFETRLRRINPSLALPYWDAAAEFSAPHTSIMFADSHFGGNGDPSNDYCVTNGLQGNLTIGYPQVRCLRRNFQGPTINTISPWQSTAYISSLIQTSSDYDSFRRNIEHSLHNSMHYAIGGRFGDITFSWSPIDLIFYPHHANIDRIWAKWQAAEPQNAFALDGNQRYPDGSIRRISLNWPLTHYRIRAREIMRTDVAPLCYTYDDVIPRNDLTPLVEAKLKSELSRLILDQYYPKLFQPSGRSNQHDFNDAQSIELSLGRPLPYPITLPRQMIKRMGFKMSEVLDAQARSARFVYDINTELVNARANEDDSLDEVKSKVSKAGSFAM